MRDNAGDQLSFYIQPQFIEAAPGIIEALLLQLAYHNPHIYQSKDLLVECLGTKRILLVIDDVNRSTNTSLILDKLLGFMHSVEKSYKMIIQVVCPVWTRNYQSIKNKGQKEDFHSVSFLSSFSDNEALEYAQLKSIAANWSLTDLN